MNNAEDDPFPLSDAEIAHLQEQAVGGPPTRTTAAQGILQMQERRKYLLLEAKNVSDAANIHPQFTAHYTDDLARIRQQLAETDRRLQEYQTQLDGLN